MTGPLDHSRTHGVELGSLSADLEAETYPLTQDAILERYGEKTIILEDGTTQLETVLRAGPDQEFSDPESVRQAVFNMVGEGAVGRSEYSDRGGSTPTEDPKYGSESI